VTDDAFGHIDYVLNFASESHVDRSIRQPGPFIRNNVALMTHLLDWAASRSELQAFIQISTDEVYGPAPVGYNHHEWHDQHLPSNPYSASKAAMEDIAFAYWRTYDLPIVITNTMNLVGETQDAEKFVPMTISKVLNGKPMTIHASRSGKPGSRFYLHARNQADGVLHVLKYLTQARTVEFQGSTRLSWDHVTDQETGESLLHSEGGTKPFRYHIVGEREVDNLEMAQMIAQAVGKPLQYDLVDFHSSRPGHDLRYGLDGEKLAGIDWAPPVPLDESLQRMVKWTLDHPEWLL
jgi:dTDP-glucose 4,6-dehydratase